jgi:hypothetical protein
MYEWCAVVIIFWIVWGFVFGYAIMAREYFISSRRQVRELKWQCPEITEHVYVIDFCRICQRPILLGQSLVDGNVIAANPGYPRHLDCDYALKKARGEI